MTDHIKNQTPGNATDETGPMGVPTKPSDPVSTPSPATTQSESGSTQSTEAKPAAAGTENTAAPAPGSTGDDASVLQEKVIQVLRGCYDPEIPVNIHELGLIYEVNVKPGDEIYIKMTLTSPMCPVAETLPPEVEAKVKGIPEVTKATVEVVWEPTWTPEMMSEAARLQLGMV